MELPLQKGIFVKRDHDKFNGYGWGLGLEAMRWYFNKLKFTLEGIANSKQEQGILYNIRQAERKNTVEVAELEAERNDFLVEGLDLEATFAYVLTQSRFIDTAHHRESWEGKWLPPVSSLGGEVGAWPSNSTLLNQALSGKVNLNYIFTPQHALNLNATEFSTFGNPKDPLRTRAQGFKSQYYAESHSLNLGLSYEFKSPGDRFLNALTGKYYFYGIDTRNADPYNGKTSPIHLRKHYWGLGDAIRYRFTRWLIGKVSGSWEVRTPSENELLGDGYMVRPAGDLLPERGVNVNVGLLFDWDIPTGMLSVEVNGFYNHLWDMIRIQQSYTDAAYINHGEMLTLGGEIEVKADATRWLYLYANTTYQDLRDTREFLPGSRIPNFTKGKRMPNIPYFLANGGLELHREDLFGLKNTNGRLFGDASFTEGFFYDFEMSRMQWRRIPRQLYFDLGAEVSLWNGMLILSGKLANVANAKLVSEYNYPLSGRTFSVKVRYVFK